MLPAGWRRHFDGEEKLSYYTDAKVGGEEEVRARFFHCSHPSSCCSSRRSSLHVLRDVSTGVSSHTVSLPLLFRDAVSPTSLSLAHLRRANAPRRGLGRKPHSSRSSATPRPGTVLRTGELYAAAVSRRTGRHFERSSPEARRRVLRLRVMTGRALAILSLEGSSSPPPTGAAPGRFPQSLSFVSTVTASRASTHVISFFLSFFRSL